MNSEPEKFIKEIHSTFLEGLSRIELVGLLRQELENSFYLQEEINLLKKQAEEK